MSGERRDIPRLVSQSIDSGANLFRDSKDGCRDDRQATGHCFLYHTWVALDPRGATENVRGQPVLGGIGRLIDDLESIAAVIRQFLGNATQLTAVREYSRLPTTMHFIREACFLGCKRRKGVNHGLCCPFLSQTGCRATRTQISPLSARPICCRAWDRFAFPSLALKRSVSTELQMRL